MGDDNFDWRKELEFWTTVWGIVGDGKDVVISYVTIQFIKNRIIMCLRQLEEKWSKPAAFGRREEKDG